MHLTEDKSKAKYQIKAYELGQITINENTHKHSLIISADKLITNWSPYCLDDLKDKDLSVILSLNPQIILLGTGERFTMPPQKKLALLYQQGYGVEIMDTGAACRTYMALVTEGRKVVAALLIK